MTRDNIVGTLHGDDRVQGALSVGGGTTDYEELENKPSINGVKLVGNKTTQELGIYFPSDYSNTEQDTGIKWIDGKTIYRKVFSNSIEPFLNTIISPSGTIIYSSLNFVDSLIQVLGVRGKQCGPLSAWFTSSGIFYCGSTINIEITDIIMYYTKA